MYTFLSVRASLVAQTVKNLLQSRRPRCEPYIFLFINITLIKYFKSICKYMQLCVLIFYWKDVQEMLIVVAFVEDWKQRESKWSFFSFCFQFKLFILPFFKSNIHLKIHLVSLAQNSSQENQERGFILPSCHIQKRQ